MNDCSDRSLYSERETIDQRMRNADEFNTKGAELNNVSWLDAMQERIAEQIMFFQFALSQPGSEMRTVNRNVKLFQDVRQRPKMVFVAVGKHYGNDIIAI